MLRASKIWPCLHFFTKLNKTGVVSLSISALNNNTSDPIINKPVGTKTILSGSSFSQQTSGLAQFRARPLQDKENCATMLVEVPESLKSPLKIKEKILLGPGPSNPHPEIYDAMSQSILGYIHPDFLKIMDETKAGIQYLFQTKSPFTFAISGTGHSGMEAALVNLLEPGDKVLILQNGLWGERAAEIASRIDAKVEKLIKPPGQGFSFEEIEQAVSQHKPAVLFVCHGESTTGVLQPLEGLGELCHRHNTLLLVDTVASLGGAAFAADQSNVDCVYSASQKVLGCPPGLAPIMFSQKAMTKILERKTKPKSFYLDAKLIGNYWGVFDEPRKYHHTAPINIVYGLRAAASVIAKEKLENTNKRHLESAQKLYTGLEKMGLKLFVEDPKFRLATLTTVLVPEGVDWKKVADHLYSKHNIDIAGGLGATAGKIWRIGLMGYNSNATNVDKVLQAMKEALPLSKL